MYPPLLPRMARISLFLLLALSLTTAVTALTDTEQLGKELFFDNDLSLTGTQSCASCHAPEVGWTGPDSAINAAGAVYEGAVPGRFGNRKPPSSAYATDSPIFHLTMEDIFIGGMFWDGRATGERLGNPAADQAQGPFLNPLEQALGSPKDVCGIVRDSSYADLFLAVWGGPYGVDSFDCTPPGNINQIYDMVALSIADYEASDEVSPFSSRYDAYLAGTVTLDPQEQQGLDLFEGRAKCSACHVSTASGGEPPLFTDFTYDNLGVPRNEMNPFYDEPAWNPAGDAWIDLGLGGFLESRPEYAAFSAENRGKMKVPTLRNVDLRPSEDFVKAYGHNGYFKSLEEIVHFYNTRDVLPECTGALGEVEKETCWPAPEVANNVNSEELGNLGLSGDEEAAIVAFLGTLSDASRIDVIKFYDANANGLKDNGEKEINGWKYTVNEVPYLTPLDAVVPTGTYTVTEKMPTQATWKSTTNTAVEIGIDSGGQTIEVIFGNLCLGPGGGQSKGFWTSRNGEKLVGSDDLAMLRGLNLRDAGGSNFDPSSYGTLKAWLLRADSTNMAYMLSAQLAAMELNVLNGKVSGSALIYAPGTTSASSLGYATVNAVMAEANNALGADGMTPAGDANRKYQEALKNALDRANTNLNFVQPKACTFSFA